MRSFGGKFNRFASIEMFEILFDLHLRFPLVTSYRFGFEDISIKFPSQDNQLLEIDYNSPVEMQITDTFY